MSTAFRVFRCEKCGRRQYCLSGTDVNQSLWCVDCYGLRMHIFEGVEEA